MLEINKIHLGNCYELIKQIPDKSIDLIYTDIPYDIHTDGGGFKGGRPVYNGQLVGFDKGIDYKILDEFCRICKKIYIYIWCSKDQILDLLNYFNAKKCMFNILVWCKTNPIPFVNNTFLSDVEYCLVFREDGTILNNGMNLKSKYYISMTNKADKEKYNHPTIKPLDLVKRHILHSTLRGGGYLRSILWQWNNLCSCKRT